MPRQSALSNPTGLVDLERQRINIVLDESNDRRSFSLIKLDITDLELPSPLNVVVIARRGNAEERIELGAVSNWKKDYQALTEIGEEGTWGFRVLLVQPGSSKLVAAAENIRPEGQGDSSSFIALEPAADLGQRPWEILILEADGRAVIRFNKDIYVSPGAAEADLFFMGMILPEAIRRVAEYVSEDPAVLNEAWEPFKFWLVQHGIAEEPDPDNPDDQAEWCAQVVAAFCDRFEFANKLRELRNGGEME